MNLPLVSILIPLYNAEQYIEETITRALKQTYPNIELIIVDDHSTDNSLEIAQKHSSDKVHIYTNPNKGGNSARNYAFQMCNGEYIKFMDADDYCTDDMIEKQMERMLADGDKDTLIFSPVKMLYPDGRLFLPPREIDKDYVPGIELLIDIWRGKGWNCPHCHLLHRELFIKSSGWDENVIRNQDGEFFARVASNASKSLSVNNVYAIWRQTSNGVSKRNDLESHRSVLITFIRIISLILNYKDTKETRYICAYHIGEFLYMYYPAIYPLIPEILDIYKKLDTGIILPNRKILKILRSLIGWKSALFIIRKFKL